jgi:hypothetical protein
LDVALIPDFETSVLLVADLSADEALDDVSLFAFTCLVTDFVALKAEFLIALK